MNLTVKRLKSLFAVFLAVMMMVSILPVSSFAVDNFDGYTPISTAEELANIKNDMNGKYYLTQDIALTGTWTPLGLGSSENTMHLTERPLKEYSTEMDIR